MSAMLEHLRTRRRLALFAAGVLDGDERARALRHVEGCARCRAEHDDLVTLVRAMQSDPVRDAVPPVPARVLAARVARAVDEALPASAPRPRWFLVALPAAAAVVAISLLAPAVVGRLRPTPAPTLAPIPRPSADAASTAATEEALARIERNLAREHAARYLADASDVLVTVAASAADCDRAEDRLDVGEAPERSRELLEKRRLVEAGGDAVASAQGVLDDVELALREVSALPSCVKRQDVDRLRRAVEDRQLLMRIRLMTRELEG